MSRSWRPPPAQPRPWRRALAYALVGLGSALPTGLRAAGAEEDDGVEAALRVAERARAAVVRVQWRDAQGTTTVDRNAVVVDPDGWLLIAGPRFPQRGTLAAILDGGERAMRAEVWASDAATCLTLARIPVRDLPVLAFSEEPEAPASVPARRPPGSSFVMVTSDGAVARGTVRGAHRVRLVADPAPGGTVEVTCLDEAAVAVVAPDLGAPWLDEAGRVVGLLMGADLHAPAAPPGAPEGLRLRAEVAAAYAVPGSVARIVWPLLQERRRVPRAALGALTRPVSPALAAQVCAGCGGHVIEEVASDGAAAALLEPMDIVHLLDGTPLARGAQLADVLLPYRPGERVRIGILREGKPLEVFLDLGRAD